MTLASRRHRRELDTREVTPFLLAYGAVILLVTFFPQLALFLPDLAYGPAR